MDPLRFQPLFRRYLWGGRRLQSLLGKTLGDADDYAESWEIVDHGDDQSLVMVGALAGTSLATLVQQRGADLLGRHHPQPRFPLLFKFLDAQQDLSVQVHPNDQQAARCVPPDFGKTEAWVVLHADPGSTLYAGLQQGVDRPTLTQAIAAGNVESCLHRIAARAGQCIFIPAGTVHALGRGLLIAEIQQSSDTTYRLFDWNRLGPDGQPRPLHIVQSLDVIDFHRGPVEPQPAATTTGLARECLVHCDKFVLNRWTIGDAQSIGGDQACHIMAVLQGRISVAGDPALRPLERGEVMLIPAACGSVRIEPQPHAVFLDMHLP